MERGLLNPTLARARRDLEALRRYSETKASEHQTVAVSSGPLISVDVAAEYLLAIQDEEGGTAG